MTLCGSPYSAHVLVGMQEHTLVKHRVNVAGKRILLLEVGLVNLSRSLVHPTQINKLLLERVCGNLLVIDELLVGCGREGTLHKVVLQKVVILTCHISVFNHFVLLCADRLLSLLLVTNHSEIVVGDLLVLLSSLFTD